MSAPIAASTQRASGSAGAAAQRPQMQSRRVSLKLGPFGITYSTDQVLWTGEAAQAAATVTGSAVASAETEPLDNAADQASTETIVQSQQAQQPQQTQTEAQPSGRTFSQEMLEAWRKQVEARAQAAQTYGPGAAKAGQERPDATDHTTARESASARSGAASGAAGEAVGGAPEAAVDGATGVDSTPESQGAPGLGAVGQETESRAAQSAAQTPVARMRRAISAYLACAQDFSSTGPMLSAVA